MSTWENIFSAKFVNAAGKTVVKTVKSTTKSNPELKKELIAEMAKKGFNKWSQGSSLHHQK